ICCISILLEMFSRKVYLRTRLFMNRKPRSGRGETAVRARIIKTRFPGNLNIVLTLLLIYVSDRAFILIGQPETVNTLPANSDHPDRLIKTRIAPMETHRILIFDTIFI